MGSLFILSLSTICWNAFIKLKFASTKIKEIMKQMVIILVMKEKKLLNQKRLTLNMRLTLLKTKSSNYLFSFTFLSIQHDFVKKIEFSAGLVNFSNSLS